MSHHVNSSPEASTRNQLESHSKRIFKSTEFSDDYHSIYWENSPVGEAHLRFDGQFLDTNQAFRDIVGYTAPELLEMNYQQITYGPDLKIDVDQANMLVEGQLKTYSIKKRYIRKDGTLVVARVDVFRVPYSADYPFGHFVAFVTPQPVLKNVIQEKDKDGNVESRTVTSWSDFTKDNPHFIKGMVTAIVFLSFLSGNAKELINLILSFFK